MSTFDIASPHSAHSMDGDARWQAVQRVLASPLFAKAPRMRAMLSFLMMRKLSGMEASISEYAIGIEVFKRDVRTYDTITDPVVRVQMGRLRDRLMQYYAMPGRASPWQILIPQGTYVPVLKGVTSGRPARLKSVGVTPLGSQMQESGQSDFVSGLQDELGLRLFQWFGSGGAGEAPHPYRLEVSVRTEPGRARATIRLIDVNTAQIAWIQHCDRHGPLGIALQEKLALAICAELQAYMLAEDAPAAG